MKCSCRAWSGSIFTPPLDRMESESFVSSTLHILLIHCSLSLPATKFCLFLIFHIHYYWSALKYSTFFHLSPIIMQWTLQGMLSMSLKRVRSTSHQHLSMILGQTIMTPLPSNAFRRTQTGSSLRCDYIFNSVLRWSYCTALEALAYMAKKKCDICFLLQSSRKSVTCTNYTSCPLFRTSDHKPVLGNFQCKIRPGKDE